MIYTFSGMYSINHCLTLAWYPLLHHRFLTLFCPLHVEKHNLHLLFTRLLFFFLKKSQIQHQSLSSDFRKKDVLQPIYSPKYNRDKVCVFSVMYLPLWREKSWKTDTNSSVFHWWSDTFLILCPPFAVPFPSLISGFKKYLA